MSLKSHRQNSARRGDMSASSAARQGTWASVPRPPDVDDVAHRDDPDQLTAPDHDQVTEPALGHRVGGGLQRPFAVRERGAGGQMVLDELAIRVLTLAQR